VTLTTSATPAKYFETRTGGSGGIDLSATFTNGTQSIKAFGFYDGASWKIRFSPTLPGIWNYTVRAIDTTTATFPASGSLSLTCVASSDPGFAQISGQFLKFSNNEYKFTVGHNNGWQYNLEQPSFSTMTSRGLNVMSFWMNSPWIVPSDPIGLRERTPIENIAEGIGKYN